MTAATPSQIKQGYLSEFAGKHTDYDHKARNVYELCPPPSESRQKNNRLRIP